MKCDQDTSKLKVCTFLMANRKNKAKTTLIYINRLSHKFDFFAVKLRTLIEDQVKIKPTYVYLSHINTTNAKEKKL